MNGVELSQKLADHGVPVSTWGRGGSKTLEHLLGELKEGEATLVETIERQLLPSQSYPGLMTRRTVHAFLLDLPNKFYREEGYQEEQPDKITYFRWQEIKS
ncbi:MAG: hypothetical protein WCT01_00230 [Candidatus Shapirobacteria bacterium]|jgi:hypothetical protein